MLKINKILLTGYGMHANPFMLDPNGDRIVRVSAWVEGRPALIWESTMSTLAILPKPPKFRGQRLTMDEWAAIGERTVDIENFEDAIKQFPECKDFLQKVEYAELKRQIKEKQQEDNDD